MSDRPRSRAVDRLYGTFHPRFARRRMEAFLRELRPDEATTILDVGGTPLNWTLVDCPAQVTLLNLAPQPQEDRRANLRSVEGDGRALPYPDGAFDIAFSNSVVEHLGTLEDQRRFAAEIRRVGRAVWVQTPARSFPVESHLLTPGVHFLPPAWQRRVGSPPHRVGAPDPARRSARWTSSLAELRLLDREEMAELFPDCEIRTERLLGLAKAYIAVRRRP